MLLLIFPESFYLMAMSGSVEFTAFEAWIPAERKVEITEQVAKAYNKAVAEMPGKNKFSRPLGSSLCACILPTQVLVRLRMYSTHSGARSPTPPCAHV
jgi:hypothetical protein